MKKTLLITHEYHPYRGGIARYCYNLMQYLPSSSYLVASDQRERDRRVPVLSVRFTSPFIRPRWLKGVRTVQKLVKEHGIELILTPHLLPLGQIAQQVAKTTNVPYVVSLHGLDINLAIQNKKATAVNILKRAQHIIVNSESTKRSVQSLQVATPVTVITPYVDPDRLTVDERMVSSLRKRYGKQKLIITVGRLVKRKGQDMVIRALPQVLKRHRDVHYLIIGSGPEHAYLEQCISETAMQKHVDILTNIPDGELGAYYAAASVFAMPTRKLGPDVEGFGIVYLEASHFALPIIAGRTGGEAEAIGLEDSALYVSGEDVEEIAESIVHLLDDRELALFLGRNAQKHLTTIPDWKQQSAVLERILS